MRRLVLLLAAIGCSSGSSSPELEPTPVGSDRVLLTSDAGSMRTTVAPNARTKLAAPPDSVLWAVAQLYNEMQVPVTLADKMARRIGNMDFWKTRRMWGSPISKFLNCGDTFSGPAADNHRIYMSLVTTVRPDAATKGSEMEISFTAQSQNMEGTSSDRLTCGSTGLREEQMRQTVAKKLQL